MRALLGVGVAVLCCTSCPRGEPPLPTITRSGEQVVVSGDNRDFVLARSKGAWGAAWLGRTGRDTSRLGCTGHCREAIYFMALDDELKPLLKRPIQVTKERDCANRTVYLTGTATGFAVTPSHIGSRFELATKRFSAGSRYPTPTRSKLKPLTQDQVAWGTAVQERSLGTQGVLRVWLGRGNKDAPHEVRFVFSPDGAQVTRQGVLMKVKQGDEHNYDSRLLRNGGEAHLFIKVRNKIQRQRFGADGALLGGLELLVEEQETDKTNSPHDGTSIYVLNVAVVDGACLILYQRGNSDEKLFSCKTGQRKLIGSASQARLLCDGARCLVSENARTLRYLSY